MVTVVTKCTRKYWEDIEVTTEQLTNGPSGWGGRVRNGLTDGGWTGRQEQKTYAPVCLSPVSLVTMLETITQRGKAASKGGRILVPTLEKLRLREVSDHRAYVLEYWTAWLPEYVGA